jgi:glycosyltransferase involved in cell wall biosynthesis
MKTLFVGHYREGTGWSQAAIDYILALDSVGVDVVCRALKLNNSQPDLPERILQLEAKTTSGSTHCIQHVLPHHMEWNGGFEKNIGLFVTESQSIQYSSWPSHLQLMDMLWVPNMEMVDVCERSGINEPEVRVIPHAYDKDKYEYYDEFKVDSLDDDAYVFYFIGEFSRRKRLSALLQAYYTAFDRNANVRLVIKTNMPGRTPEQVMEEVSRTDKTVREQLRLYNNDHHFPSVSFITDRLTDAQINGLHRMGDCFVTTTFGDAWCIPAFDALHFGNAVISSDVGGMKDYLYGKRNGFTVSGQFTPVFGESHAIPGMGTGREEWFEVNISHFRDYMKAVYDLGEDSKYISDLSEYGYEVVGNKMKEALCEI